LTGAPRPAQIKALPKAGRRPTRVQPGKLTDFLDASYDVTADDPRWLRRVMESAGAVLGSSVAAHGAIYDASDVTSFKPQVVEFIGLSPPAVEVLFRRLADFTPSFVARTFRALLADSTTAIGLPEMGPMLEELAPLGLPDAFNINGLDPCGFGVFMALWVRETVHLSAAEVDLFRCMAHHLGAAHRVRRRLREAQPGRAAPDPTEGAEAIIDGKRRVVHATGPARGKAERELLIATAEARERARKAHGEAGEELRRWQPLTRARWTLVDSFERGGVRYVVARENQSHPHGFEALSDRERQVIVYFAVGQSTKETAYALGISDTTVRVLLSRAAAKLGVRSRRGLLAHPQVRAMCLGSPANGR